MCCQLSSIRTLAAIAAFCLICPTLVSAQNTGGTDNQGGTDIQGGNTGTGGTDQAGAGAIAGGLNADEAFSGIQRGDTIGATTETGLGFSDVGANGGGLGGGLGGFGGGGFGGGLGGLSGGQNFGGQSQNSQPLIRTRLRSAIEGSYPTPQAVGQRLSHRIQTVPRSAGISGVNVSIDGTTAIVTGVVSTNKQRRMTELLMRLEPGVRRVENRITVAP